MNVTVYENDIISVVEKAENIINGLPDDIISRKYKNINEIEFIALIEKLDTNKNRLEINTDTQKNIIIRIK